MSKIYTSHEMYMKTFFEIEIYFLAHPSEQEEAWAFAHSDDAFGTSVWLILESWSAIEDNRKEFNLSINEFERIKKLFDLLKAFIKANYYPNNPSEYRSLLQNPDWNTIQRYAKEIYDSIYSRVK